MGQLPWYKREKEPMKPADSPVDIPEGLVETCKGCGERMYKKELTDNCWVCPKCDYHHRMPAREWLRILMDDGIWNEFSYPLYSTNPLKFSDSKDYEKRLVDARKKTGLDDACVNAVGSIAGRTVVCSVLDFFFMGGSMGSIVGEKITRAGERALKDKIPFITITCSGGARMQEGMFSLMQLVKTSHVCGRLRDEGVPFISILADPSTAGVMASFASLGDLIIAEQKALIGFAGPRVIAQTIGGSLPEGFQRAEFCRDHGFVDIVVHRLNMRSTLGRIIRLLTDAPIFTSSGS